LPVLRGGCNHLRDYSAVEVLAVNSTFLIRSLRARRVDVRLPGKGNSTSYGAKPFHIIITIIKWIRTSNFSIKLSLFLG